MNNFELNDDKTMIRKPELPFTKADDEIIILNMETNSYLCLNSTAATIWELLENPQTLASICEQLEHHFAIEKTQCEQEVRDFLYEMMQKKVIHVISNG